MSVRKVSGRSASLVFSAFTFIGLVPAVVHAQADHDHGSVPRVQSAQQNAQAGELVKAVREATEQFKNPAVADSLGYKLAFGCVSGGDYGAMGLHLVNMSLVDDNLKLDEPEIILYEPLPDGKVQITGADYLIPAAAWDAKHPHDPPQLMGQLFHFFDSPNRFGLDPFYTLHVWAWKENPNGAFTNWNPNVSCDAFVDTKQQ